MKTFLLSVVLMSWLSAPLPGHGAALGQIGDVEVTVEDLHAALGSLSEGQMESVRSDPKLLEQVVRSYLVQQLLLKRASDAGWQDQPQVRAKIERARASVIVESFLESATEPPAAYPSEPELRAAYQEQRDSLRVPRSFRLAQIFVPTAEPARLKEVTSKLKAGKQRFESLAQDYSADAIGASRGGEIGWLTEAQIEKDLMPVVAELKLNGISDPVQLKDGWHILKLLDSRATYVPTFEQVRSQLVAQLRTEKLRANSRAYLADLLRAHPLTLDTEALSKALPIQPLTTPGP